MQDLYVLFTVFIISFSRYSGPEGVTSPAVEMIIVFIKRLLREHDGGLKKGSHQLSPRDKEEND